MRLEGHAVAILSLLTVLGCGDDGGQARPVGEWTLPAGYFTPARMPMDLVHPRDDVAPAWAYAKNAYPGIRWEIPIVVQGGAWPFQYSIVDDGGATGLAVGSELERTVVDGFVVHQVTPEYGVLGWDDPREGSYSIRLEVTDQEGTVIEVPISLTVGTEGWLFVDPDTGDDTAGDGSRESPFASLSRIHERDASSATYASHRIYLSGTVPMDGNQNGNLRLETGATPGVLVGLPGSGAVLEEYEGKLIVATEDVYLANLELRQREDYLVSDEPVHLMLVFAPANRATFHDVTFSRMQGTPLNTGLGNSGVMMLTRGSPDVFRSRVSIVNCTITGPSGVFASIYSLEHSVIEKNRWIDADLSLHDGSVPSVLYMKEDNGEYVSIRANEMVSGNTWDGLSGIVVNQAKRIEVSYNVVDTPYDDGRSASIRLFGNSPAANYTWTTDTPIWLDRNSLRRRLHWEGEALENMPDATVHLQANAVSPRALPTSSRLTSTDDVVADELFDAEMHMMGAARLESLGRAGAEVAAPEM